MSALVSSCFGGKSDSHILRCVFTSVLDVQQQQTGPRRRSCICCKQGHGVCRHRYWQYRLLSSTQLAATVLGYVQCPAKGRLCRIRTPWGAFTANTVCTVLCNTVLSSYTLSVSTSDGSCANMQYRRLSTVLHYERVAKRPRIKQTCHCGLWSFRLTPAIANRR